MHRLYSAIVVGTGCLLMANTLFAFDRQDSLRGGNGRGRNWWDVQHYELQVSVDTLSRQISGTNIITFRVTGQPADSLQVDLQQAMQLDAASWGQEPLAFSREGNVYWLRRPAGVWHTGTVQRVRLDYSGTPRAAVKAPWDGGFIRTQDEDGRPWIAVACQGLGASCWWPCKDYQGDEPDSGMTIRLRTPGNLVCVSNGRSIPDTVRSEDPGTGKRSVATGELWSVRNPINTYDATFYIGDYVSWADTFQGLKGVLGLHFYALRHHEARAREQFRQVRQMLQAFEYWFGPYPFYEDGYKIVEAPFLGMEHQGAIAYGNEYQQGYKGKDRSGTGVGLLFDFIIVHESGHEWFGNSITAADIADNWIHEGLTTYSETLFAEYWLGREKAWEYTRGEWRNIRNDKPVIGVYGVQDEGSGDKYDKGSALVHTLRLLLQDDDRFRQMLQALCRRFYHQQVTTAEVEQFISSFAGTDYGPVFDQYLRTVDIPQLELVRTKNRLRYRFSHIVKGFSLPVTLSAGDVRYHIRPDAGWQELVLRPGEAADIAVVPEFLIGVQYL